MICLVSIMPDSFPVGDIILVISRISALSPLLFSMVVLTIVLANPVVTSKVVMEVPHVPMYTGDETFNHTCRYIPDPEYHRVFTPSLFTFTASTLSCPHLILSVMSNQKLVYP